jgi:SAM-dependent methyltransferase
MTTAALTSEYIATEEAPRCPACEIAGKVALRDCVDRVTALPGHWAFSECRSCGSLWLNPRPRESALASLYPENYNLTRADPNEDVDLARGFFASAKFGALAAAYGYDALARSVGSNIGAMFGRIAAPLLSRKAGYAVRYLAQRDGGRLLDVGCGNGAFIAWMQRLGWQVEGIELDPITAAIARKRGLTIHHNNVESLDLPLEHFDAITLTHVTEHFLHPRNVFRILHRWLKPGGVLVSLSPNPRGALRRMFGRDWYELDPPRHIFLPSTAAYRRLLEPLGFEVKTQTSMRPFHWMFKESASIAKAGRSGAIQENVFLKLLTSSAALLLSILPESGEEVICHARKQR